MTAEKTASPPTSGPNFAPPGDKASLEQGRAFMPKFDEKGLIPCIATDHKTGQVLMFAYMNREALAKSLESGEVYYWSRSRGALWHKGATSGHIQKIVEIRIDCDQDVLWVKVDQIGGIACHTGRPSCFYRLVKASDGGYVLDFNGQV